MIILATNDDGIYAPGLWILVEELRKVGEVVVVAPDREQSGVGTSVTLHQPLRLRPVTPLVAGVETYSVEGTPADSVILALRMVLKGKPDLVVSGINEGANLGNDVLISGTVGAALQGFFHQIPAIALSVTSLEALHFDTAARLAGLLAGKVKTGVLSQETFLNINLPNLPLDEIQGIEITRLAQRTYADVVQEGHDGKRKYYWIVRGKPEWNKDEGTDIWTVEKGMISITPLRSDLTSVSTSSALQGLCSELLQNLRSDG